MWAHEEVHTFRQFLWDSEQKSARKKFDRLQLPPSERFVYLVKCYLANGISVSSGTLFFTQRHLIFVGKAQGRDAYSQQNYSQGHKNLRVTIPLRNVLSFHRAKLMVYFYFYFYFLFCCYTLLAYFFINLKQSKIK